MFVTSLLCGPWVDLWAFYGLYCKRFSLYIKREKTVYSTTHKTPINRFCNLIGREQLFFSFQWFQKWLHKLYFCLDINEIYSITHDISIVTNFSRRFPLHLDILLIAFIPWNTTMNQAIVLLIKNGMGYCEKKEIALTTLKSSLIEILMLISRGSSLKSSVEFAKIPCNWLYT